MASPVLTLTEASSRDFIGWIEFMQSLIRFGDVEPDDEMRHYLRYASIEAEFVGSGFEYHDSGEVVMEGHVDDILLRSGAGGALQASMIGVDTSIGVFKSAESFESIDSLVVENMWLSYDWRLIATDAPDIARQGMLVGDGAPFDPRGDNVFDLRGGDDDFFAGRGDDILYGGEGDDTLSGGPGADRMEGGIGADLLIGGAGDDSAFGGGGGDALAGRTGQDRLFGGGGDDRLNGGAGSDRLVGGRGADLLTGGGFADLLRGQDGDDRLRGGAGRDRLDGGAGDDILLGGAGRDLFVFGDGDGFDLVQDMTGDDFLDLRGHSAVATFQDVLDAMTATAEGFRLDLGADRLDVVAAPGFALDSGDVLI